MTIETLNAIKSEAVTLQTSIDVLNVRLSDYEVIDGGVVPDEVDQAWANLTLNLDTIINWVNQAIADGTVEEPQLEAMIIFLSEIKAVFEKYSAVLSVIDGAGYGDSYGGADVIQFTVTDPVSGQVTTKEFIQTSLSAVDLV